MALIDQNLIPLPISAIILTHNEEKKITDCLKSLDFCQQVLVIDSDSQDKTLEKAKAQGATVISLPWSGFTDQRNKALQYAEFDWVLSIDADERVSPQLRAELLALFTEKPQADAYTLPRKTIHMGRWIRYGGWYPNRLVRLFNQRSGKWDGGELHERWVTNGVLGSLKNDLIHFSFDDLEDQVARNNLYSTLGAKKLDREGRQFTLVLLLTKTTLKFLETYIIKRGFLDGYPGFFISVSAAYSVFLKWAKLWELRNNRLHALTRPNEAKEKNGLLEAQVLSEV